MATKKREEPRLRKLSAICMKLPEVERSLSGDHADFRVRGKVFWLAEFTDLDANQLALMSEVAPGDASST